MQLNKMKKSTPFIISAVLWLSLHPLFAQKTDANIFGDVKSNGVHIPFVTIALKGTSIGTTTDNTGHYMLTNLPVGKQTLVAQCVGYKPQEKVIEIEAGKSVEINFEIEEEIMYLNDVVVTGTRTFKRRTETPVVVNILDNKSLNAVQACNISEGLRFQPGLRVETDCQTCSYTQLRMNGLGGGYSQILINGRPVFSPLIGLYGMEQIPSNMVERIEVVRGGGSALYGSSAIGGTVNVITQIPTKPGYEVSLTTNSINGEAADNVLTANTTMLSANGKAGVSLFANRRVRDFYDHPGITLGEDGSIIGEKDNFSELPALESNSFGGNLIFTPTYNQKLEANFTSLYEYRYGGEMTKKRPIWRNSPRREPTTFLWVVSIIRSTSITTTVHLSAIWLVRRPGAIITPASIRCQVILTRPKSLPKRNATILKIHHMAIPVTTLCRAAFNSITAWITL